VEPNLQQLADDFADGKVKIFAVTEVTQYTSIANTLITPLFCAVSFNSLCPPTRSMFWKIKRIWLEEGKASFDKNFSSWLVSCQGSGSHISEAMHGLILEDY